MSRTFDSAANGRTDGRTLATRPSAGNFALQSPVGRPRGNSHFPDTTLVIKKVGILSLLNLLGHPRKE